LRPTCGKASSNSAASDANDPKLDDFVKHISYFPLRFDDPGYAGLKAELDRIAKEKGIGGDRLFYLATAPEFFAGIVENLGAQGMAQVLKTATSASSSKSPSATISTPRANSITR
jgi:glucose-6-phosphate 1-dehydrogenase